eukprot:m.241414 g.241414  ORF g.241414 m.241414 type:complete len:135 (+) comp17131_c4_seq50:1684-2088(+)
MFPRVYLFLAKYAVLLQTVGAATAGCFSSVVVVVMLDFVLRLFVRRLVVGVFLVTGISLLVRSSAVTPVSVWRYDSSIDRKRACMVFQRWIPSEQALERPQEVEDICRVKHGRCPEVLTESGVDQECARHVGLP